MAAIVHVSEQASLAIVEISTASLTFLFATLATAYRGFTVAKVGFIYLSVCSLIHIVGSACYVGGELGGGNSALQDVYAICNFISVGPLIMASLAFSHYSDETATSKGGTAVLLSALQIIPVVGLVLAIAGGVQYSLGYVPGQDAGNGLLQAASIVFLISMTTLVIMTAINVSYARTLRTLAVTVSMPFLGIRVILSILEAWAGSESVFAFDLPTFPVQIFMRFIMEFIVVMLFLFTGLGALANPHDHLAGGRDSADGSGVESKLSQRTETPLIAPPAVSHQPAGGVRDFQDNRSFQDGHSFQEGRSFNDGRSF